MRAKTLDDLINQTQEKRSAAWYHARLRSEVVTALGGKCVICGFSDPRALQIDHINGGGTEERKQYKTAWSFLNAVLENIKNPPLHYQLLCANCNAIKRAEKGEVNRYGKKGRPKANQ